MKKYTEYKQSNFAQVGTDILNYWKEHQVFEKLAKAFPDYNIIQTGHPWLWEPNRQISEEWQKKLTPEQYSILRHEGTELSFGKVYDQFKKQGSGTYYCAGCNAELFSSKVKFDSRCGWPSFYDPSNAKNVKQIMDPDGRRVEVRCAVCDGPLGHVFTGEGFDTPTDQRYCINGVALKFMPA